MRCRAGHGVLLYCLYACAVASLSRRKQTRSLAIGPPEWADGMHFQRQVIVPGGNVIRLSCPAEGKPPPKIDWTKDGIYVETLVSETGTQELLPEPDTQTLKLLNAQPQMSGNYTCLINNKYGRLRWTFMVQIIRREPSRPVIRKRPVSQTVVEGSGVTLECRVLSDLPLQIKWIRNYKVNGSFLSSKGAYKDVIRHVNITEYGDMLGQTLSLNNVKESHTGWYTCIAQNHFGQSHASAWLEVISRAEARMRQQRASASIPTTAGTNFKLAQIIFSLFISYFLTFTDIREYLEMLITSS